MTRPPAAAGTPSTPGFRPTTGPKPRYSIHASGVPCHPAYYQGMTRLSCSLCVLASRADLVRAAQLRPELAAEYADLEAEIGHRFRDDLSMAEIIDTAEQAATAVDTEEIATIELGEGRLWWPRFERQSDRYGTVFLLTGPDAEDYVSSRTPPSGNRDDSSLLWSRLVAPATVATSRGPLCPSRPRSARRSRWAPVRCSPTPMLISVYPPPSASCRTTTGTPTGSTRAPCTAATTRPCGSNSASAATPTGACATPRHAPPDSLAAESDAGKSPGRHSPTFSVAHGPSRACATPQPHGDRRKDHD